MKKGKLGVRADDEQQNSLCAGCYGFPGGHYDGEHVGC